MTATITSATRLLLAAGIVTLLLPFCSIAYVPSSSTTCCRRTTMTMKVGRRSVRKQSANGNKSTGGGDGDPKRKNWIPVQGLSSPKELPQEENVVRLVDTMAKALTNGATNPTGAVSVVKFQNEYYCFSSSCSTCNIPLLKARILPPSSQSADNSDPRLVCNFCGATYNVRTGAVLPRDKTSNTGLFGGIVKGLFSANANRPLPTYELGDKNGQVLIHIP